MTDYERGLADAAEICRKQARRCIPYRRPVYQAGFLPRLSERIDIAKRAMARMAIRCARDIDAMGKRKE